MNTRSNVASSSTSTPRRHTHARSKPALTQQHSRPQVQTLSRTSSQNSLSHSYLHQPTSNRPKSPSRSQTPTRLSARSSSRLISPSKSDMPLPDPDPGPELLEPDSAADFSKGTPTPRKNRRRNNGRSRNVAADQRGNRVGEAVFLDQDLEGSRQEEADLSPSSEDELMDLLGVASPSRNISANVHKASFAAPSGSGLRKGMLAITKDDIAASMSLSKDKFHTSGDQASGVNETETQGNRRRGRQAAAQTSAGLFDPLALAASHDIPPFAPSAGRSKKIRGQSAQRDANSSTFITGAVNIPTAQFSSFDTSSLSKSLPTGHGIPLGGQIEMSSRKKKGKKGKERFEDAPEDESAVWDMPDGAAEPHELTWQQKLQATQTSKATPSVPASNTSNSDPSSRRGNKSNPSDSSRKKGAPHPQHPPSAMSNPSPLSFPLLHATQPSPLNPSSSARQRPNHNRRFSLDDQRQATASAPILPSQSNANIKTTNGKNKNPNTNNSNKEKEKGKEKEKDSTIFRVLPSAFDISQPFHTGFNVHRAPQTPSKPLPPGSSTALPLIQGDFPRLAGQGHGQGRVSVPSAQTSTPNPAVTNAGGFLTPGHGAGPGGGAGFGHGIKYAGPTFHNSPHAASLARPDLEDF